MTGINKIKQDVKQYAALSADFPLQKPAIKCHQLPILDHVSDLLKNTQSVISDRRRRIKSHRNPTLELNSSLYEDVLNLSLQLNKIPSVEEYLTYKKKSQISTAERYALNYLRNEQKYFNKPQDFIKKRALSDTYDQIGLISKYVDKKLKELQDKPENKSHLSQLNSYIQLQKDLEGSGEAPDVLQEIKESLAPDFQKHIYLTYLQQKAIKDVYGDVLPQMIDEGFYNPAIVYEEMKSLLGVSDDIPQNIATDQDVKNAIILELMQLKDKKLINGHQAGHILDYILPMVDQYRTHFKGKSIQDTVVFMRHLSRLSVYQEYYDKSSFSGSDHGSKHIHNNIHIAKRLHADMHKDVDYTDKDQFMEQLIHIAHDVGYTCGLATYNFSCSKDHPLIGAKIIEANKDFYTRYLDEEAYKVFHKGVLYHAVMSPDLTPGNVNGYNKKMIRAVTSISDACAVTYDRKSQEFWEQPKAIIALAKLKIFLTAHPEYAKSLGSDEIAFDEWFGLDKNKPMDQEAHDVFQSVKRDLHELVETNDSISEDKKELFRQAIDQQFNGFKANVTLGQYGGVLVDAGVVEKASSGAGPKYIPEFTMSPSLLYNVLKDLFGEEQANRSFAALCKEFSFDVKKLNPHLANLVGPVTVKGDNVHFKLKPLEPIKRDEPGYFHLAALEKGVKYIHDQIETFAY